ncbi:MAG TPA: penicillin-binding protein activator [Rhizomicrobium sp.]|nr:penicillin-binding protein activator [Rhizomicrobium sp.]
MAGCGLMGPSGPAAPTVAPTVAPTGTIAKHPLTGDEPGFTRLGNMHSARAPVRVGILLPFNNGSPATRALAASMMKSAELAVFDSGNPDILLLSADEGSNPEASADAVRSLLAQGAEVIVGPLFAQAAEAVGPVARDRGVPVISFSTDRRVAGDGTYLLSFLPEAEVRRIVSYAAAQGQKNFAALVPQNAYGDRVGDSFKEDVKAAGATVTDVEKYVPATEGIAAPAHAVANTKPDAILIAQGGPLLREIASSLAGAGTNMAQVKLLGTGLWDDQATSKDPMLAGGVFAAPSPEADAGFEAKYRSVYGASPPQLASLAYDAVSLVALLSSGTPYKRFTQQTLMDPNGFAGVDGIFRFRADGTSERGLAVMSVEPGGGFRIVSPAPKTFQPQGS